MSAIILNGKEIANNVLDQVKTESAKLSKILGRSLNLCIVSVSPTEEWKSYIKSKLKKAESIDFATDYIELSANISQLELESKIKSLSNSEKVDGIILQLPIPKQLNSADAIEQITPYKDLDGLCRFNKSALLTNQPGLVPCTPLGIIRLIEEARMILGHSKDISGLNAVVVGRSELVGRPTAELLLNRNCTVTVCHSKTKNLMDHCVSADILVSATGKPGLIKSCKNTAILIDVGITHKNNEILGDIDFEALKDKCAAISPVPGGVGPMTVAMLMQNLINAVKLRVLLQNVTF